MCIKYTVLCHTGCTEIAPFRRVLVSSDPICERKEKLYQLGFLRKIQLMFRNVIFFSDSCINHRLQYSRMKNLMNIVISSSAKMVNYLSIRFIKKNELKVPRHYTWFTTSNFHAGIDFRRAALMSDLMALA
uniref:Uncharacterized protein n=1 Tax=Rhizophagus irregularis (strain DAOM 181602 / DAOM 197198 / MUCL 43194) TaxID=747089 RepID=U9TMJ7_RHIID